MIWLRRLFTWVLGHLGWGGGATAEKPPRRDDFVPLREAIIAANTDASVDGSTAGDGNDQIVFDASLAGQSITLGGAQLPTITGLGARLLSIDGNNLSRILEVNVGVTVEVSGLTLTGGNSGNASGGAILNAGNLTITGSQIEGNIAETGGGGGGIYNNGGTLTVINSTISGNRVTGGDFGGGIFNDGTATITNSTIADNTSGAPGGGIRNHIGDTLVLDNTIVSGNNITGSDPMIGSLQNNGGPTDTHALSSGSSAVGSGSNSDVAATDQRGFVRIADGDGNSTATVDIGAYEVQRTSFTPFAVLPTQNGASDFTVGDFNNDGILDLAAAYNGNAFPANNSIFA